MNRICCVALAMIVGILAFQSLVSSGEPAQRIRVLYPENVQNLFEQMGAEFVRQNPGIDVALEPVVQMALVSRAGEVLKGADVIAVSDSKMLGSFLQSYYAGQPVEFLNDAIAILASPQAKYFDELGPLTWHKVLLRPDVRVGIPDPEVSPAGFRIPLVWKLSETWVRSMLVYEHFTQKLGKKNGGGETASVVSLLKSGELDYGFDYSTAGRQAGLRLFSLNQYYDLSNPELSATYRGAAIEISLGKSGEKTILYGEPVIYSIGVLKNSAHPKAARAFVDFVSGPQGQAILQEYTTENTEFTEK